eukprot:25378-Eustigmatos_ZCMA.PRE.1
MVSTEGSNGPAPLPPMSAHICPGLTLPLTPLRMRVALSGRLPIEYCRSLKTRFMPWVAGMRFDDLTWKSLSCV